MNNNLIISDYPLMVLPKLAVEIGLNEAIILQQVHYWLKSSNHFHENKKWIYNTYESWKSQFPFWGKNTIIRAIKSLEDKNLLITGNFNKLKIDNTKWYTINYAELEKITEVHGQTTYPIWVDGQTNLGTPLPETTSETNKPICANELAPDSLKDSKDEVAIAPIKAKPSQVKGKPSGYTEEFEQFWAIYPRKTDKKAAFNKFKTCLKTHPLETIIKGTEGYISEIKKNKTEMQFVKHPKTFLHNESFNDFLHVKSFNRSEATQSIKLMNPIAGQPTNHFKEDEIYE